VTDIQAGDPGLFGPSSVTWQMHGDPMMWVAGVRALYLQALHPRAVRGVMQNSDFRNDAWGRLMRTANFVGTITYGTTEAAERAGARVRKIHTMLSATDPDTGESYGVDEPDLLLWVHCAEVDSYLHVTRRSGFRLTDAQADRYIAEQRAGAPPSRPGARGAVAACGAAGLRGPAAVRPRAVRQTGPETRHRHTATACHGHPAALRSRPRALATPAQAHPARHGTARPRLPPHAVQTRTTGRHTGRARGGRDEQ
jgi:ER-bound oxygenase mpaB/B'/Rubber oxygenase, catalytic domain